MFTNDDRHERDNVAKPKYCLIQSNIKFLLGIQNRCSVVYSFFCNTKTKNKYFELYFCIILPNE